MDIQHLTLDERHVAKHLPHTVESERLLRKEGMIHVFYDRATMLMVAETIKQHGEYLGEVRGHPCTLGLSFC